MNAKGQLISKCLFGVFTFFQKMNENKLTSSKVEFVCSFFGRNVGLKKSFRICLTFTTENNITNYDSLVITAIIAHTDVSKCTKLTTEKYLDRYYSLSNTECSVSRNFLIRKKLAPILKSINIAQ